MSLAKWAVGLLAFQIIIVILLIGIAPIFSDNVEYDSDSVSASGINSSSAVSYSDMGLFDKFTFSVGGLPFPMNYAVFFPTIIGVVLGIMWIRGVS